MKQRIKRVKQVLSIALVFAIVLTGLPYWPGSILPVKAASRITQDVSALLKDWSITNDTDVSAAISIDTDGTKVLTVDQTSAAFSMGPSAAAGMPGYSGTTILKYMPRDTDLSSGYMISADVKVVSVKSSSNSLGFAIGDSVTANGINNYAYTAFRAASNVKAVYLKTTGTYGSTDLSGTSGTAPVVSVGTNYSYSFSKSTAGYNAGFVSDDKTAYFKTIATGNVNSTFFDPSIIKTTAPTVMLEGVKAEIRNLKVTDKDGKILYDMNQKETDSQTDQPTTTEKKWDGGKVFQISIGGETFSITPGIDANTDFRVEAQKDRGMVEVATSSEALVWADLHGNGAGILTDSDITDTSDNISTTVSGNEITVTYKDGETNPSSYKIYVKDNSASGVPKQDGVPISYQFTNNSVFGVISNLHAKKSPYVITNTSVTSQDKLVTFTASNSGIYYNDATHGIGVGAGSSVSVKVAGDADIDISNCAYSSALVTAMVTTNSASGHGTITPADAISTKTVTDADVTAYHYTGDAATITFTYTEGSSYVHTMTVTNKAPKSIEKQQEKMPSIMKYGAESSLSVSPVGQRLVLKQSGGNLKTENGKISNSVSYYAFDTTTNVDKVSADVVLNTSGASNYNGIFFGAFNNDYAATVGIRNSTNLRGIYSKSASDMVGAGGVNTGIDAGVKVTFTAQKTDKGFLITATPKDGATQSMSFSYQNSSYLLFNEKGMNTDVSYGFIMANATATITNMKYYDASGKILYDQNDCYTAAGTAPIVDSLTAVASDTRDSIKLNWNSSTEAEGDGRYVIQVSEDDGNTWRDVVTDLTDKTYVYGISQAGEYKFRVSGMLGTNGVRNTYAEANKVHVIAALQTPEVSISSTANEVTLNWKTVEKANRYEVYRYSYDEKSDKVKKIAELQGTEYIDKDVQNEIPYYYYIKAYSTDNYSNPSQTVWTVPSAGHIGQYQYEDASAGITITKKSHDTIYSNKITLEGISESAGNVVIQVNGVNAAKADIAAKGAFKFDDIVIQQGRNDVNLLVTDKKGSVTRKTFNFVYLTNYHKIVDAAFTGNDGEKNENGAAVYKTVQAAVNSVGAENTDRVVILVKAGDYNEQLRVASPYITLIGEDSSKTRIHYFDSVNSPVGGDMSKRCAVYIQSTATGFSAENLTIENDYQYLGDGTISNESADALRSDANNASYVNIRIVGYQDTLCANQGTQYYYKCYITGNVDFIYGNDPRAFFNDCELVFRYSKAKNSGYVTAPKTAASAGYGLTFYNCRILSEEGCSGSKCYLARPWGQDGYATWINCYMGRILKQNAVNPYSDMSGALASAARFYEYGNYGPAYEINAKRRQISPDMANNMTSASYLSWDPYAAVNQISSTYKGNMNTKNSNALIVNDYTSVNYSNSEGDDTNLDKYAVTGYAKSANVTGGGIQYETSDNYYKASNAKEFLTALTQIKQSGSKSVIELTSDIALGSKEINDFNNYSTVIKANAHQALTHPTLIETGVSTLTLDGMSNLTIYSKNGAKITHTSVSISNSSNIIIRNLKFDELWEWDESTSGNYDLNDWDYMTIEKGSQDIWVDHCTFYKAYDGVIDVKTPISRSDITISWNQFLPGSDNNTFFKKMMNELAAQPSKYPYYSKLLSENMTQQQIYSYAYGQKKTSLFGQDDNDSSAANIYVTLANNYYKNSMDRMPRLRYGTVHVFNSIMDAQDLRDARATITNPDVAQKIVSNGASSTCNGRILLENSYISGITNALNSGNGDSPHGYINAINSLYFLDGKAQPLEVTNNNTLGDGALIQNPETFKAALPYDYTVYNVDTLSKEVQAFTGAGVLKMTTLQWEKTTYTADNHEWDEGVVTTPTTCSQPGVRTYTCTYDGQTRTEIIPALGHEFSKEWTIDKAPTTTEAGVKSHHCLHDNTVTDETVLPKIEVKDNIQTYVEAGERISETGLMTDKETLINHLLTAEELAQVAEGSAVKFYLKVNDAAQTVNDTEKSIIQSALKNMGKSSLGMIWDISLFKQIGNKDSIQISEPDANITIRVKVPDNLKNTDRAKTRDYKIVRIHDLTAEVLDAQYDKADDTITFVTDKFSTYAIIYTDTPVSNEDNNHPQTTENNVPSNEDNSIASKEENYVAGNETSSDAQLTVSEQSPETSDSTSILWFFILSGLSGSFLLLFLYMDNKKRKTTL